MKRLVMTMGAVMLIAVVGYAVAQDGGRPGLGGERKGPPPRRNGEFDGPPRDRGEFGEGRPGQPPHPDGRPGGGPPGGGPPGGGPPGGPRGGPSGGPGGGPPGGPHRGGPGPEGDYLRRPPRHDWENLKELDPDMYKLQKSDYDLERETGELSMKYRLAPAAGRASVKQELTKAVNDHFEVRQKRRRLHLERLEEELERLRSAIEQRDEARPAIVKRRVDEMTGESE
ncbi:MAG: hypothetical protein ACI9HK_003621, partial [Pirellulaceae bacterium]